MVKTGASTPAACMPWRCHRACPPAMPLGSFPRQWSLPLSTEPATPKVIKTRSTLSAYLWFGRLSGHGGWVKAAAEGHTAAPTDTAKTDIGTPNASAGISGHDAACSQGIHQPQQHARITDRCRQLRLCLRDVHCRNSLPPSLLIWLGSFRGRLRPRSGHAGRVPPRAAPDHPPRSKITLVHQ